MSTLDGKNIVFVLGSLELGGAERQSLHFARYLRDTARAKVRFVGFSGPGKLSEMCDRDGIPWRVVPNPLAGQTLRRTFGLVRFGRALRQERPFVLLPYTMTPNVVCGLTWRWTGARLCVWNQRDSGVERLAPGLERKATSRIPQFLSNSRGGAELLTGALGVAPERVRVIPNGVQISPPLRGRKEWRETLGLGEETFLACMVANLSRHKDQLTLLHAWRLVCERLGSRGMDPFLVLAGRFDDQYPALRDAAGDLGIGKTLRFLGFVDDVSGLLGAADLGVFSSRSEEGCPNGVLECMAAGLPVVAVDIAGTREIAGSGDSVRLTPAGDAQPMAERIIEYALSPPLRRQAGEENRRRIANEFSLEKMCEETLAVLSARCKP